MAVYCTGIYLLLLFLLIPAIMAVVMSFTSYNGFTAMKFIGIDNYTRLFQDTYFCSRCGISVCMF